MRKLPAPDTFADKRVVPDKWRTSYFDLVIVDGIEIQSRYKQAHEFDLMAAWMQLLPSHLRAQIAHVLCDSKATYSFTLTLRHGVAGWLAADEVVLINDAMIALNGGHNGIHIESPGGRLMHD